MILECPSCRTRYLVQIGLFAQGGRQVRCARCKHEWHANLPTNIDVVAPPLDFAPIPDSMFAPSRPPPSATSSAAPSPPPLSTHPAHPSMGVGAALHDVSENLHHASEQLQQAGEQISEQIYDATANLPAIIKKKHLDRKFFHLVGYLLLASALIAWPILDRKPIVKVMPALAGFYDAIGLHVPPEWDGLVFESVKSELRYDSGTMKLYVDGVIHNTTAEVQFIPDIKARALGPDRRIIQDWWVEAPAATVEAGGATPFHTEIATPMERTIEDVYLEFYSRDEKADVRK